MDEKKSEQIPDEVPAEAAGMGDAGFTELGQVLDEVLEELNASLAKEGGAAVPESAETDSVNAEEMELSEPETAQAEAEEREEAEEKEETEEIEENETPAAEIAEEASAEPASTESEETEIPVEMPVEVPVEELHDGSPAEGHEETAETTPEDPKWTALSDAVQQVSGQLDALSELFRQRILHTEHEEKVIDQMHKELQSYKSDLYAQLVRPILLDVIEVRDSILRISAAYLAKPEGQQDIPNKTFAGYAYDLQDILEKNQIEICRSHPGDPFSPLQQRAIKKIPTSEESLHGKIAESLSCGYLYMGKSISPEKVSVYTYEKP